MPDTVLYISYNGINEPLVQSQVLNYLEGLTEMGYRFTLLTFEKNKLSQQEQDDIHHKLSDKKIAWHSLPYHHNPQFLGTAMDVWSGTKSALKLAKKYNVKLLHARSFVPALIALIVKKKSGLPFVNDIRGFWVDEKVLKGSLSYNSFIYSWLKKIELNIYVGCNAIVSLSQSGIDEIKKMLCWQSTPLPFTRIIPTCVDHDSFVPKKSINSITPVFGYVGSMGPGYLGREVFSFFKIAKDVFPDSRLLIVSKSDHNQIIKWMNEAEINASDVEIISVEFSGIPRQIARMDVGLSFMKSHYSTKASCPTKLGEYLATGVPVVAIGGVGDTDTILEESGVGVILSSLSTPGILATLIQLKELMHDNELPKRCRATAENSFSLDKGITAYSSLYCDVLS